MTQTKPAPSPALVPTAGPFIRFAQSGRRYYYHDPSLEPPLISDLLWGLGGIVRGLGQWSRAYDVLRHSWVCYQHAFTETHNDEFSMAVAFHDLHEAVTHDLPTPLKTLLPEYKAFEDFHAAYLTKLYNIPTLPPKGRQALKLIDTVVGDVEGEMWVKDWQPIESDTPRDIADRSKIRSFIERSMHLTEDQIAAQLVYELMRYHSTANIPPSEYIRPISVRKVAE